jgi:hypothetical protein
LEPKFKAKCSEQRGGIANERSGGASNLPDRYDQCYEYCGSRIILIILFNWVLIIITYDHPYISHDFFVDLIWRSWIDHM